MYAAFSCGRHLDVDNGRVRYDHGVIALFQNANQNMEAAGAHVLQIRPIVDISLICCL